MSKSWKTHYEALEISEACTQNDIKNAFLKLSKKYHPDMNSADPGLHAKFVRINEAYSILSKSEERRTYDITLRNSRAAQFERMTGYGGGRFYERNNPKDFVWRDESIWSMRDRTKDRPIDKNAYYGFRGISRKPNSWIATGAFLLMGVGALCHYVAFKETSALTVNRLNSRDRRLSTYLEMAKAEAQKNGNHVQLELLVNKFKDDANRRSD